MGREAIVTTLLVCVSLTFLGAAISNDTASLVPMIVAIPTSLFLLTELWLAAVRQTTITSDSDPRRPLIVDMLWFAAAPLCIVAFGFVVGSGIYVFVFSRYRAGLSAPKAFGYSVITSAIFSLLSRLLVGAPPAIPFWLEF